ncbi:MAG: hypothetical protein AAF196_07890 [Planctomycetota bacterium]
MKRLHELTLVLGLMVPGVVSAQETGALRVRRVDETTVRVHGDLVRADEALAAVATAMDWELRIDSRGTGLGRRLADELLDLSVEDDARQIARWIGYAVDAQVALAERTLPGGLTTELVIRPLPSPETDGGRERSLQLAVYELESWLEAHDQDELLGPASSTGRAVRIALGPLEREIGQPELGAQRLAEVVYASDDDWEYQQLRQTQLIELARCWFDAGPDPDYDVECDRSIREALRIDPKSYEAARAAELLARLLYRRGDDEACLAEIPALIRQYGWVAYDEPVLDAHLTCGHAALRLGDVQSARAALREAHERLDGELPMGRRGVELAGLEGALAYQTGNFGRVVTKLGHFLSGVEENDPRVDGARLLLADSCLRTDRYAQAWRLTRDAFASRARLSPPDYLWSAELYLESGRAVGLERRVLRELELEVQVRSIERVQLLLFVVDRMLEVESFEAARNLLLPVVQIAGPTGDEVRLRMTRVVLAQAIAAEDSNPPSPATRWILQITEPESRRRALSALARFYTHFGQHDRAAAVWQGILP